LRKLEVKVKRLDKELPLPQQAHSGDAGYDLRSRIDITLKPFQRALIPTGIIIGLPPGWAGFVQPRSGLALKHGLSLVNTPGLIDSSYRGEIGVIMINLDPHNEFTIKRGDKIAQLVIKEVAEVSWEEVEEIDPTSRGPGGFGSTGR
jgi:dUTP pyrophosphatase